MMQFPIIRHLRRLPLPVAAAWFLVHDPLAAQSRDAGAPGSGDSSGSELESGLTLTLDYPKLEVAENRAYIPLFFTINGTSAQTGDIRVRASFVEGSATPGEDFLLGEGLRLVPVVGGLGSINWVEIPLVQDESAEGDETAVFDLTIEGSMTAPVRMEVLIKDDMAVGEVGFVSSRFSANEGSPTGHVELRLWRTLNTRKAATITYRLAGTSAALAALGGEPERTAVFQAGESQIFVRIPLVNDTEAQGNRDITMTIESSSDGMKVMKGFETTVLTLADDETKPEVADLSIWEGSSEDGERGVVLSTMVPRGYQVRLEFSDQSLAGPWQLYWIFQGADVERTAFNRFDASLMRMFRILPPEPLDITLPW